MEARRDQNRVTVALGWDATNSTPKEFKVDPSTGRLLIEVASNTVPTATDRSPRRDDNRVPGGLAWDGTEAEPLKVDTNGYLIVDMITE